VIRKQHTNCFIICLFNNALTSAEIQNLEGLTDIFNCLISYIERRSTSTAINNGKALNFEARSLPKYMKIQPYLTEKTAPLLQSPAVELF